MSEQPDIRIDPTVAKPSFNRADHCRAIASKGGQTTYERWGSEYMRIIGQRGLEGLADKIAKDRNVPLPVARAMAIAWLSKRAKDKVKPKTAGKRYLAEVQKIMAKEV